MVAFMPFIVIGEATTGRPLEARIPAIMGFGLVLVLLTDVSV